jgi:probable O-glycosylation ligase (exosortase A-associated)
MVATLFGAIGTQSRGALVAMVGVGFFLWLRTPGKLVSGIAIAGAVAAVLAFMPASWTERMHTIENFEEDTSAMGRVRIWVVSFDIARSRPLLGGGFRSMYSRDVVDRFDPTVTARAAHSIYFEALGEHGFVVFGIWVAIIATGVLYTFRLIALARDRPELRWAADLGRMSQVSIIAYLSGGAFLSLAYWDVFWTLLIVLGATYALAVRAVKEGKAPISAQAPQRVPAVPGGWRGRPAAARTAT